MVNLPVEGRSSDLPTISVCIPTFNRASCLANLLKNLCPVKDTYGRAVEICISNNHSTDGTEQVIEDWRQTLQLKVVTQHSNIGATKNVLEVTRLATGRWILIIGDDDELISSGFASLIALVEATGQTEWILAGVGNGAGVEHLLGDLEGGLYDARQFRKIVLRTGLYRFGFIGMHLFPSILRQQFCELSLQQAQPWPHIALFLRHLQDGSFRIFSTPVVNQAAGGNELYWTAGDWALIRLRKLDIIAEARKSINRLRWFYYLLMLRELYSFVNLKQLILWKAIDATDFKGKALSTLFKRYFLMGPLALAAIPHFGLVIALYCIPTTIVTFGFNLIGRKNLIKSHQDRRAKMENFDGVKRGL